LEIINADVTAVFVNLMFSEENILIKYLYQSLISEGYNLKHMPKIWEHHFKHLLIGSFQSHPVSLKMSAAPVIC